jgi:hypothetical protein
MLVPTSPLFIQAKIQFAAPSKIVPPMETTSNVFANCQFICSLHLQIAQTLRHAMLAIILLIAIMVGTATTSNSEILLI